MTFHYVSPQEMDDDLIGPSTIWLGRLCETDFFRLDDKVWINYSDGSGGRSDDEVESRRLIDWFAVEDPGPGRNGLLQDEAKCSRNACPLSNICRRYLLSGPKGALWQSMIMTTTENQYEPCEAFWPARGATDNWVENVEELEAGAVYRCETYDSGTLLLEYQGDEKFRPADFGYAGYYEPDEVLTLEQVRYVYEKW